MGRIFSFVILAITSIEIRANSCISSDCTSFANVIKNSMNIEADPCEDFNEYACGRWEINNPIPQDNIHWSLYEIFRENIMKQLMDILNGNVNLVNPTGAFHKVQRMYQNCMNVAAVEMNGVKTILSQLKRSGEWPVIMPIDEWIPNGNSLYKMHEDYTRKLGLQLFYGIKVYPMEMNSSFNFLQIAAMEGASITPILLQNSRNSLKVSQYVGDITKVIEILASEGNNTINIENLKNDVDDLVDFQISMNKILYASRSEYHPINGENLITIDNYQKWYNNHSRSDNSRMEWINFLQSVFKDTGIRLRGSDTVLIPDKRYIMNVVKLLDATSLRTIVNYVQWNFVKEMLRFSSKKLRDIDDKLLEFSGFFGIEGNRNELCLATLGLRHALSHEYMKLHFPKKKKEFVNHIAAEISQAADKIFGETVWVTPEEKKILREKLSATEYLMGYPDWYDDSAINDYYEECIINENFMENIIEVRRFNWNLSLKNFGKPIDKDGYTGDPVDMIASYSHEFNLLVFTAGFAQNPQFSEAIPRALQYATFGSIIGHELTHAYGNFRTNWWSNSTKYKFTSKARCLVDQYSNYKIYDEKNVTLYTSGYHTLHENIGDLHGLKTAYKAYENGATSADRQLKLLGLESYNDKQLFFLAYANLWCSATKSSFQNYLKLFDGDKHSAPKFRIIGVLSNMKEFSDAFNCSIDSPMNPRKKCVIWGTKN